MKKSVIFWGFVMLFALTTLTGCLSSPGMTSAEVHRMHMDTFRANWNMIQYDFDTVFMLDGPSRLTPFSVR